MTISVLFLLELPPSLWAFGIDYYLPWSDVKHSTLHLLDAIIIIMNFAVLFIQGPAQDIFELLVLLRLWRMVKLLGGMYS
jgi:voltage-gated hydrogen channel 1